MSLHRPLAALATAALLGPIATASAQPNNKTRATRAVRAEIKSRYSGFRPSDVTCKALTSRRFKCTYVGFTHDLADGPCRGTARATVYPEAVDVTSVSRYRCDL